MFSPVLPAYHLYLLDGDRDRQTPWHFSSGWREPSGVAGLVPLEAGGARGSSRPRTAVADASRFRIFGGQSGAADTVTLFHPAEMTAPTMDAVLSAVEHRREPVVRLAVGDALSRRTRCLPAPIPRSAIFAAREVYGSDSDDKTARWVPPLRFSPRRAPSSSPAGLRRSVGSPVFNCADFSSWRLPRFPHPHGGPRRLSRRTGDHAATD